MHPCQAPRRTSHAKERRGPNAQLGHYSLNYGPSIVPIVGHLAKGNSPVVDGYSRPTSCSLVFSDRYPKVLVYYRLCQKCPESSHAGWALVSFT